jgi:FixJ family two-component response regulator
MKTQSEILEAFEALPPKQRLFIAKKIQEKMSDKLFEDLDISLPNVELSESEIMTEIKAVRYGNGKENQNNI